MPGIGKAGKYCRRSCAGFTLIEVLMAVAILAFCLCGLLATYVNMFFLTDLTRDVTLATNAVRAKMEEIRRLSFPSLNDGNSSFNLTDYGFPSDDSVGVVWIQGNYSNYTDDSAMVKVRVSAYFKSRGRIIGEDADLDGVFDTPAEDVNNNSRMDSPVEMVTLIAK